VFNSTQSLDDWQQKLTKSIEKAKSFSVKPKGERVPVLITVDSLNMKSAEKTQDKIRAEGFAEDRGFPIEAMKITRYLKAMDLIGTTANVGFVQHLVQDISAAPGYNGPQMKESGAIISSFATSMHLRMHKGKSIRVANHAQAPQNGPPIEGYQIWLSCERSCIGPDKNQLCVDFLWQHVENEDGSTRQAMWYDWDAALGRMLVHRKYADKEMFAYDKDRMNKLIPFTQPKTDRVNCEMLGLEGASLTEFGKAIRENAEAASNVKKLLNIIEYPDIQGAEIDFENDND
jgi:hypothetical protein